MPRPITLATGNPAKRAQLRWLLAGLPLAPVDVAPIEVPETATTLEANACLKAVAYSRRGGLAISSDGGLDIPELIGVWDPVRTARQGQARLRALTAGLADRRAHWVEAIAIADSGRLLGSWTESGTEGVLAAEPWPQPRAFWVWDIFVFPGLGKTWAELSPGERERVDLTWLRLRARVQAMLAG